MGVRLRAAAVATVVFALTWYVCQVLFRLDAEIALTVATFAGGLGGFGTFALPEPVTGPIPSTWDEPPEQRPERIWNVGPQNPQFTGRGLMLIELREILRSGHHTSVQALRGMGGVGKTQLAIEYAHRFIDEYTIVWWIDAEQPATVGAQMAALAAELRVSLEISETETAGRAVKAYLHNHDGWLLIFDNVTDPAAIRGWLPGGPGHVIITSRVGGWDQLASTLDIDVFQRSESVALLQHLLPHRISSDDAGGIADHVGDLPLALAQAGSVMAETSMSAADYKAALATDAQQVLAVGVPPAYPQPFASVVSIAVRQLAAEDVAAEQLLKLCAWMAPEPVPIEIFLDAPADVLSEPLASVVQDRWVLHGQVGRLGRYGLAKIRPEGPQLHRLTQLVLREQLDPRSAQEARGQVNTVVVAATPGVAHDPKVWPRWTRILPHLLALDLPGADSPELRRAGQRAAMYLYERGDYAACLNLADSLFRSWRRRFGPDDVETLSAAHVLAIAYHMTGQRQAALEMDRDTYERRRRVLGEEHRDTLISACHIAARLSELGRLDEAIALGQITLERERRVLGYNHISTLGMAHNLAHDLQSVGRLEEAEALLEDTLIRRRTALGNDHPHTLEAATILAIVMHKQGRLKQAAELMSKSHADHLRVLGSDHPNTLEAAFFLAIVTHKQGRLEQAAELMSKSYTDHLRVLGSDHPQTLACTTELALLLYELGNVTEALSLAQNALPLFRRIFGNGNPETRTLEETLRKIQSAA